MVVVSVHFLDSAKPFEDIRFHRPVHFELESSLLMFHLLGYTNRLPFEFSQMVPTEGPSLLDPRSDRSGEVLPSLQRAHDGT